MNLPAICVEPPTERCPIIGYYLDNQWNTWGWGIIYAVVICSSPKYNTSQFVQAYTHGRPTSARLTFKNQNWCSLNFFVFSKTKNPEHSTFWSNCTVVLILRRLLMQDDTFITVLRRRHLVFKWKPPCVIKVQTGIGSQIKLRSMRDEQTIIQNGCMQCTAHARHWSCRKTQATGYQE